MTLGNYESRYIKYKNKHGIQSNIQSQKRLEIAEKYQEQLKEYELKYGSFDERLVKYFGNNIVAKYIVPGTIKIIKIIGKFIFFTINGVLFVCIGFAVFAMSTQIPGPVGFVAGMIYGIIVGGGALCGYYMSSNKKNNHQIDQIDQINEINDLELVNLLENYKEDPK